MSKDKAYIFSTLTAPMIYTKWGVGGGDLPVKDVEIYVAGGTNIPDKHLVTPYGVMTTIDAVDLEWLEQNEVFKLHKENGFITVRDKPAAAEKVAADMNTRDGSAPLVDADFAEDQKPVTKGDDTPPKNNRRA